MRIAFLTNSILATESIAYLHSTGLLKAVGVLARNRLLRSQIEPYADQHKIKHTTFQKNDLEQVLSAFLQNADIDLVLVQTFPYKIPESCLAQPRLGCYNLHPGPLPGYRGPDPVFWVLKNEESHTAMTLHKMEKDYDTGPIVVCEPIPIHPGDTYGILNSHLAHAAPVLLDKFLEMLQKGVPLPLSTQSTDEAGYQSKPDPSTIMIQWSQHTSHNIASLTRACNPNQNGSIAFFRDVITRFLDVEVVAPEFEANLSPGTILTADATRGLQVKCIDKEIIKINVIHVDEGYFSGKRFLEAFNVKIGEKFTPPSFLS